MVATAFGDAFEGPDEHFPDIEDCLILFRNLAARHRVVGEIAANGSCTRSHVSANSGASSLGKRSAAMEEIQRIADAATACDILGLRENADASAVQKAWKRLVFNLHPDRLLDLTQDERVAAAEALHAVHQAKEDLKETAQASGEVDVPASPELKGRPVCTCSIPGQRRWECSWLLPQRNLRCPVEKYEVYGPRIFSHEGEPMEWVLLATLSKLEVVFVFVEESPAQQEVMWAGDRVRATAVPLSIYAVNGRGRSDALYVHLPWSSKFPWLSQGFPSLLCRHCCAVVPKKPGEKLQCATCDNWITAHSTVHISCPKCRGEALWDTTGTRLDCRLCGKHLGSSSQRNPAKAGSSLGGIRSSSCTASRRSGDVWNRR